ncbi:MAG: BON domain-containing protein [Myxococcales bacterium]|nr:MAG: BON domain-containing protein [Myxococcales bacterium]
MSNPYDRNQYGNQNTDRARRAGYDRVRDEDPNEDRNMWQSREEDGGWGRDRHPAEDDWARNNGGANRFERGNERRYSDAAYGLGQQQGQGQGQARRGYGTEIYGESGLGERNRDETWRSDDSSRGYERGGYQQRGNEGRGFYSGAERSFGSQNDRTRDYSHGFGPNHGFGYGSGGERNVGGGDYRREAGYGSSGYGAFSGGSSSYSPTGLDRDRLGARGEQGYGRGLGGYAGRGPKDYKRTDERIREDVCERLSQDDDVDASEISVRVESGEVTLEGSVETRRQKHRAEELAADVLGVEDVHNSVRVRKSMLSELKDKVTGEEQPTGGHAGSGTKTTAASPPLTRDHNQH